MTRFSGRVTTVVVAAATVLSLVASSEPAEGVSPPSAAGSSYEASVSTGISTLAIAVQRRGRLDSGHDTVQADRHIRRFRRRRPWWRWFIPWGDRSPDEEFAPQGLVLDCGTARIDGDDAVMQMYAEEIYIARMVNELLYAAAIHLCAAEQYGRDEGNATRRAHIEIAGELYAELGKYPDYPLIQKHIFSDEVDGGAQYDPMPCSIWRSVSSVLRDLPRRSLLLEPCIIESDGYQRVSLSKERRRFFFDLCGVSATPEAWTRPELSDLRQGICARTGPS